jgi:hypothetical protein
MKNNNLTNISLVLGFIFCSSIFAEQLSDVSKQVSIQPTQVEASRVIYLDPQTGKLTSKRPAGVAPLRLSEKELNAMSKSTDGLEQVQMSNGGYKLDYQGRFQNYSVVTLDQNGKQKHHCLSGDGIDHKHDVEKGDEK